MQTGKKKVSLTVECSPWRPSRQCSRSWFRLSLNSCSCFSSSIKWSMFLDFPFSFSFGFSSSFWNVQHTSIRSGYITTLKIKSEVKASIAILTFLSDSFPLVANGGGIKDGTYLQININDELPYQFTKNTFDWLKYKNYLISIFKAIPRSLFFIANV